MMSIRKVPVGVRHHDVGVRIAVALNVVIGMDMPVMRIVDMFVRVLVSVVRVQVPMKLRQVQPRAIKAPAISNWSVAGSFSITTPSIAEPSIWTWTVMRMPASVVRSARSSHHCCRASLPLVLAAPLQGFGAAPRQGQHRHQAAFGAVAQH